MAEATPTAQAAPAIDYEKLGAAIAASLAPTLAEANKPLVERLEKLAPAATQPAATTQPAAAAAGSAPAAPVTLESVQKAIADALGAQQKTQQQQQARDAFLQSKMADLPAPYRNQMPQSGDPAELTRAEQQIRQQYQADFKAAGGTAQTVNGDQPAGAARPGAAVDTSKLGSVEKIALGLKTDGAVPLRPGQAPPPAQGAAAGG